MSKEVVMDSHEKSLIMLTLLSGIFCGTIVFANIAAGIKLIDFLGLVVPAGTLAYCFTFPITYIVDEIYGKRRAVYIVWAGLITEILMLLLIYIDYIQKPLSIEQQELYVRVFSPQVRIVIGSIVAYLASQHHDVWAFWKWREITRGKYLWLRNNASTIVSQLIDSSIFTTIAFYGTVPTSILIDMIISLWLFKVIIALADTPFVYLGVILTKTYVLGKESIIR